MMEYWKAVKHNKDENPFKPIIPIFHHSITPAWGKNPSLKKLIHSISCRNFETYIFMPVPYVALIRE
ncbi:MAG: hypothetical protein BA865_03755 [Desulfobacterales bacterium S5133MH4]|nr:MAG: hypothetical protein BA865_03755 [Desulfobacterales bacterium S5133MH4]